MNKTQKRFTRRNPDGKTYRVWMDFAGEFQMKTQPPGGVYIYGDLVNRLGELEDKEEQK